MVTKKVFYHGNKFILVDEENYNFVKSLPLYEAGSRMYPTTHFKTVKDGKVVYCRHRLHAIINQTSEGKQTDHINGLIYDNRKINLRTVTPVQNSNNVCNPRKNKYLPGVFKKGNKYRARVVIDGSNINLGYFDTPEEAHAKYMEYKEQRQKEVFKQP